MLKIPKSEYSMLFAQQLPLQQYSSRFPQSTSLSINKMVSLTLSTLFTSMQRHGIADVINLQVVTMKHSFHGYSNLYRACLHIHQFLHHLR